MRALLLLPIVGSLCLLALWRPKIGLYGYIWFALMRPDVLAFAEDRYPFSIALAVTTILGSVRYVTRAPILALNPISRGLLLLQFPLAASVVFALDPALSYDPYLFYLRVIAMALFIPILIQEESELRWLLLVMAGSFGFLGLKFGAFILVHPGAQFQHGYGGLITDNNDLALACTMTVPLCWYGQSLIPWRVLRLGLLGMVGALIITVVATSSRGGSLALAATLLLIALRSKHKISVLLVLAMLAGPFIYMVRETYFQRMSTLRDPGQEASAHARMIIVQEALDIWQEHPVTGVGFGSQNFANVVRLRLGSTYGFVAHNTYLQMLADSGLMSFIPYLALLFGTIIWLGLSARRVRRLGRGLEVYPRAIQTALVGFAVGSTFLSRIQFDYWYLVLMAGAAWHTVEARIMAEQSEEISPEEPAIGAALHPATESA